MYIVTEDIEELLKRWARKRGFLLPDCKFFTQLTAQLAEILSDYFPVLWVESFGDFRQRMAQYIDGQTALVSIDEVYIEEADHYIRMTRLINFDMVEIGRGSRSANESVDAQIKRAVEEIGQRPVTICDDGCWTGGSIIELVEEFQTLGVKVEQVIVGLSGKETRRKLLAKFGSGLDFKSGWEIEDLIDWVCERDFFPGVPLSGKLVGDKDTHLAHNPEIGASYLMPFGKPTEWASIPESKAAEFSERCLTLAIKLWEEIERVSGKTVNLGDLDRIPLGLQGQEGRLVHHLKRARDSL